MELFINWAQDLKILQPSLNFQLMSIVWGTKISILPFGWILMSEVDWTMFRHLHGAKASFILVILKKKKSFFYSSGNRV